MLNENQLAAVEFKDGLCLCLAGPGSGKTTVLVERILSLIDKGVDPSCILVITFTKDAAKEMKDRFLKKSHPNTYNVTFGTFHSVFFRIIKRSEKYHDFSLLNDYQKINLLSECLKYKLKTETSIDYVTNLLKDISLYQNTGKLDFLEEDSAKIKEFLEIYEVYKERKLESKVMDFDDILVHTKELLSTESKTLKIWQRKFSYFLVDEFQDINDIQFQILRLLVKNNPCGSENLFVVGDDDQSIYGFRGANPKVMLDFPKEFKDVKTIFLDTNYRSAQDVVFASKRLIDVNENRFPKDYKAFNKNIGSVSVMEFQDEIYEGEILSKILYQEYKDNDLSVGVLYRNRSRKNLLYNLLKRYDVPIFTDEAEEDFRKSEVALDLLSYIKLALGDYKREDIIRVMNKPERNLNRGGLFKENIGLVQWRDYYPRDTNSYNVISSIIERLDLLGRLSPFSGLNYILKVLGYDDYLLAIKEKNKEEYEKKMMELNFLIAYSRDFNDYKSFIKDLNRDIKEVTRKRKDEKISFYTFHGSKGLEFDKVYILDAVEGVAPSKNAVKEELLEEERRMFYVAMTRAKKNIVFCVPKKISGEEVNPSRFLMESGVIMV